jgi:hypothetical protein
MAGERHGRGMGTACHVWISLNKNARRSGGLTSEASQVAYYQALLLLETWGIVSLLWRQRLRGSSRFKGLPFHRAFYTSAQNAAFETPHKTRANANRTFKWGNIKNRRVRIYTSASDAFKLALAQRQAFPTRQEALPTLAFITLYNLH